MDGGNYIISEGHTLAYDKRWRVRTDLNNIRWLVVVVVIFVSLVTCIYGDFNVITVTRCWSRIHFGGHINDTIASCTIWTIIILIWSKLLVGLRKFRTYFVQGNSFPNLGGFILVSAHRKKASGFEEEIQPTYKIMSYNTRTCHILLYTVNVYYYHVPSLVCTIVGR